MNLPDILKELRKKLGDVEGIIETLEIDYTDVYLIEYLESAIVHNYVLGIIDFEYQIEDSITINPEPSTVDALIIVNSALEDLMMGDLSRQVRSGEFGIRFRSGQDEISTIEASKKVSELAQRANKQYRKMVMAKIADKPTGAERTQ